MMEEKGLCACIDTDCGIVWIIGIATTLKLRVLNRGRHSKRLGMMVCPCLFTVRPITLRRKLG